jgi:protein-tyrosine phosphatase
MSGPGHRPIRIKAGSASSNASPVVHNFGPAQAGSSNVFGAERPGYPSGKVARADVEDWLAFMEIQRIKRLVCLLPESQLAYYSQPLLERYREFFGADNVLHAPIEDFVLATQQDLLGVMRFLSEGAARGQATVVHCSGGIGRTGHVLAAWLAYSKGLAPDEAINAVKAGPAHRDPREAVSAGRITRDDLTDLLEEMRTAGRGAA